MTTGDFVQIAIAQAWQVTLLGVFVWLVVRLVAARAMAARPARQPIR